MNNLSFIFAGNRAFVLEELLERKLNVQKIFVVKDSYLQKYCESKGLEHTLIVDKNQLTEALTKLPFDVFIANGLPLILPISKIKGNTTKLFVNVHPSYLPDLRGADPVPGAILFSRDSGATCHLMDDGIDTGAILAQEKIAMDPSLDAGLLYRLSFIAERKVIAAALDSNFNSIQIQQKRQDLIYYTFKEKDLQLNFKESAVQVVARIKAFNTPSKGAFFYFKDKKIKIWDAELITNKLLLAKFDKNAPGEIVMKYEKNMLVKTADSLVKLKQVEEIQLFPEGANIQAQ